MTQVTATSSPTVALLASQPSSQTTADPPAGGASTSTLPTAEPLSGEMLSDAMSMLYSVLSEQRQLDFRSGQDRISADQKQRAKAMADQRAALERQIANEGKGGGGFFASIGRIFEDAANDLARGRVELAFEDVGKDAETAWNSPAFWSDLEQGAMFIAKVALAVGSVAATLATAGTAGPLLVAGAIALSAGGIVVSQTRCLDGALGNGASLWAGITMEIGGAALNLGGGLAAAGTSGGSQTLSTIGTAAETAGGSVEVVAGAAHIRNGKFAADRQVATADAKDAMLHATRLDGVVASLVESLQQSDKSHQRAQSTLASAIGTTEQTAVTAASITVRG